MTQPPREVRCECGRTFTATNPRARFCSAPCRKRASREGRVRQAAVIPLTPNTDDGDTPVTDATRAELEAAGQVDSMLGRAALALAARIDTRTDTGSALASAVRGLAETMRLALSDAQSASTLDELKARRRAKRGA